MKPKTKAKPKLDPATLKSVGQRVVDYWLDTGQCLLCSASAGIYVGLPKKPHDDHCELRNLK